MRNQISNNKIRQIFLLVIILLFVFLISFKLREFLPSVFGAVTLYVLFRDLNVYLVQKRAWKTWVASIFLIVMSMLVIVVPVYFILDMVVSKVVASKEYVDGIVKYAESVNTYIRNKVDYDISSSFDLKNIGGWITKYSSVFLSSTINIITTIVSTYFILYFMLVNSQFIEKRVYMLIPLKRANIERIGDKFKKMIWANVIGIPVVAIGQGITLLIGYLLFGVSSPFFFFVLTCVASVIPVVGGAIVYVPIALTLLASDNMIGAVGILGFGLISAVVDNIFRFTFLKKIENIHPLNSVFGIILGLKLFGFIGLVFGPILTSITILLIQVYHNEFSSDRIKRIYRRNKNRERLGKTK